MGSQKNLNKAAKKIAADGKITKDEGAQIQKRAASTGANAAIAIARAAIGNQAQIASQVQRQLGLEQTKKGVNYTPAAAPLQQARDAWSGGAMKPGIAPITGFKTVQTNDKFSGSTNNQVPVYTFFNKGVPAMRANAPGGGGSGNSGGSGGGTQTANTGTDTTSNQTTSITDQTPMNGMTEEWGNSVDSSLALMQEIVKQQIENNAQQTSLYMGMMQDTFLQLQAANQRAAETSTTPPAALMPQAAAIEPVQPQSIYAVTTTANAPAQGAIQTQAIGRRKPPGNTDLSIATGYDTAPGAGLNLAI